jgi:hypothetical protein
MTVSAQLAAIEALKNLIPSNRYLVKITATRVNRKINPTDPDTYTVSGMFKAPTQVTSPTPTRTGAIRSMQFTHFEVLNDGIPDFYANLEKKADGTLKTDKDGFVWLDTHLKLDITQPKVGANGGIAAAAKAVFNITNMADTGIKLLAERRAMQEVAREKYFADMNANTVPAGEPTVPGSTEEKE